MTKTLDAKAEAFLLLSEKIADENGMVTYPVDPVQLAVSLGVQVHITSDLDSDVAGVTVKSEGSDFKFLLNGKDDTSRQRRTAAHQLGHIIYRDRTGFEGDTGIVDSRNRFSPFQKDEEEMFANQFAIEFLMPASAVRSFWARGKSVKKIAGYFDVTVAAMENRLVQLNLY